MRSTRVDNVGMEHLLRAISILGTQSALGAAIGVSPQVINNWVRRESEVPAEHCPAIERATNGAVRCEDLRPAVDWSVLRNS